MVGHVGIGDWGRLERVVDLLLKGACQHDRLIQRKENVSKKDVLFQSSQKIELF